ncbi:MAG: major capsid protein [Deferribacteraceae bacterium]|jgi:hypothetical protein|nr:major capsid protein [Deferribacteraceae bacterium]
MPNTRLSEQRIVDPVLTELALGYSNLAYVADKLFPEIEVQKEGFKVPKFSKESFAIRNTIRNINADSNRINTDTPETVDIVLDEHDLEAPYDYREENDANYELEKRNTFIVTEGVMLKVEKQAADMALDAANYAADNKITISGADAFSDPNSDPIAEIEQGKETIRRKTGRRPNVMVIGAALYAELKEHPQLLEKIKYTEKGIVTALHMQEIFGIETVVIGEAVYTESGVTKDVWGKHIVLAYSSKLGSMYEPTYGYTFKRKGMPQVDTYVELGGKRKIVRYTSIKKAALMGMDAGYLISEA